MFETEESTYDRVIGLRWPDGELVWVPVNGAPQFDEHGDVARTVFAFKDVTDRRQRERELERFETLFTESADVNAILNTDGTFQYLLPSAKKVLGYEPEELIGENPFDYVQSDDRERITAVFERMVENPAY